MYTVVKTTFFVLSHFSATHSTIFYQPLLYVAIQKFYNMNDLRQDRLITKWFVQNTEMLD